MNFKELFEKVYGGADLTMEESRAAVLCMMESEWQPAQTGAFLSALHMKGETSEELAGFAIAMRERAVRVPVDGTTTLDTCGTGGDKKGSFNISTLAAFVLAGAGIPVAKHGNRASSSACGSADLLEALGIRCRLGPEEVAESLEKLGFAFLFAPDYHPATKSVVAIRKQLAAPTIFNYLGPLTNPVFPSAQLIGVFRESALSLIAQAIRKIDPGKRVMLIHSSEGWDEATPSCEFHVHPTYGEAFIETAQNFGLAPCAPNQLLGGSAPENAKIAMSILNHEAGPRTDTVLLNAALAYLVFHPEASRKDALHQVKKSLDSGAALNVVQQLRERFPL